MAREPTRSVQISTSEDGSFQQLVLRNGALGAAIAAATDPWTQPILLYGPDADAEIDSLLRASTKTPWTTARSFRDLVGQRRGELSEMEQRLDLRFYDNVAANVRARLSALLRGDAPFDELVEFAAVGLGEGYLSRSEVGRNFVAWVEQLCNTTGLILPWQMKNSFLPAVVLAVWERHPRLYPLVLHFPKRFGVPSGNGLEVAAGGIRFDELALEAEDALGMTRADFEKAYRVWQLSRVGDTTKSQATTPKTISRETAQEFLGVAARARTQQTVAMAVAQRPAPVIFELNQESVGLKHGAAVHDAAAVVKAGATSLRRRVQRLKVDTHISNIVPSASEILEHAEELLGIISEDDYGDAEVIELGLELNALQWHIHPMQTILSEVSIGELTGLFATANLFLSRFPAWQDYTGGTPLSGQPEDGVAAFDVARELLESARNRHEFLTPEATARIAAVLERTGADSNAPPLREGLVRSGENLAAVTAQGLSHVALEEVKAFGRETKGEAYKVASKGIVTWGIKNAPLLLRLGELRDWPWLTWLQHILPK